MLSFWRGAIKISNAPSTPNSPSFLQTHPQTPASHLDYPPTTPPPQQSPQCTFPPPGVHPSNPRRLTHPPRKPIHPAVVHFPIAFLALAFGLDILNSASPRLPATITNHLPLAADATRASYYLLSLGLLTALPAIVTGTREAIVLIARQGMYETDKSGYSVTVRTKVKAMIAHAVVNDLVMGLSALVWYKKRAAAADTLAGKLGVGSLGTGAATYEPSFWMVVLQGFLFAGLMMGANIGGSLTYLYGVGFVAGGGAKKKQ